MGSWHRRVAVTAVLVGWLAAPLAACAAELMASATDDHMAFCQDGENGQSFQDKMDCCPQSDAQQSAGLSKTEPVQQPTALAAQPPHPAVGSARTASAVVSAPLPPVDTGPPDCISFAVLLI